MTQKQNDLILAHLKEHKTINPLQALWNYMGVLDYRLVF